MISLLPSSQSRLPRSSGKNYFAYFAYMSDTFEVLEPNLMECNLSELTLTSFEI
jgi:hypothetical protein